MLKNEEKDIIIAFIISALSLFAATNINSTMDKIFNHYFEDPGNNLIANIIYTVATLIFCAIVIVYITRYFR